MRLSWHTDGEARGRYFENATPTWKFLKTSWPHNTGESERSDDISEIERA